MSSCDASAPVANNVTGSKAEIRNTFKFIPSSTIDISSQLKISIKKLKNGIKNKEGIEIEQLLAPDVLFTNGPDFGKSAIEFLELDKKESDAWRHLDVTLEAGGGYMQNHPSKFCYPYIAAEYNDRLQEYELHYFAPQNNTIMLDDASIGSNTVADVSFEFVLSEDGIVDPNTVDWVKVKTTDGLSGYVKSSQILFPTAPLICLSKDNKKGIWLVDTLIGEPG